MHPAYSVIFFTTASGAGYGLLALLAVSGALGLVPAERWLGFIGFGLAFGLITAGLLASSLHLGRPERAWRAFSQWRSSWLSREGVLAVVTYVPAGMLAIAWVFFETAAGFWSVMAWLSVICAILTVYCTGQIYASLRTIRQWHHPLVAPVYLVLALATGAVCLNVLLHLFGIAADWVGWTALTGLGLGLALKLGYWWSIDTGRKTYTVGRATGLGRFGSVRPLDPAHTQANFLMREMGYKVARLHAAKLRALSVLSGFIVPAVFVVLSFAGGSVFGAICALLAFATMAFGIFLERWLFFAEAEHVVNLYYGATTA